MGIKNTISKAMFTLHCKGKIIKFDSPIVMGIINATPDSFFEGHLYDKPAEMLVRANQMIQDGASILDIGGQSTRPGSQRISAQEELDRVMPVIENIHHHYPNTLISIDTYYSTVAKEAILAGASIVNDISAGNIDETMIDTVAALKTPYICMHMNTRPETMQQDISYKDVVNEVFTFFEEKINLCTQAGIEELIIDPGFGFGKTANQNFQLLNSLSIFKSFEKPLLVGLSRKSMIYNSLNINSKQAINGTTVLNSLALLNGASILRVHDVKEAKESITLMELYKNAALV